jgi:UDP-N-acetylmuramoyl-tripeptide--D-alanyl-D-alanine ligase
MIEALYQVYLRHPHIQTDTRKLTAGEIFFALKGPNFNGNTFVAQALETGAAAVVADEDQEINDLYFCSSGHIKNITGSCSPSQATLSIPFIAITGSNGKTITKELIHAVLSTKYKTSTTVGNQ